MVAVATLLCWLVHVPGLTDGPADGAGTGLGAGPPSVSTWLTARVSSELYLHLHGHAPTHPWRQDLANPGREWGRLGRSKLGHRDTRELITGALDELAHTSPCREADLAVLFGCHRNPEK